MPEVSQKLAGVLYRMRKRTIDKLPAEEPIELSEFAEFSVDDILAAFAEMRQELPGFERRLQSEVENLNSAIRELQASRRMLSLLRTVTVDKLDLNNDGSKQGIPDPIKQAQHVVKRGMDVKAGAE